MEFDFNFKASESPNQEVIQRAVDLIADDYKVRTVFFRTGTELKEHVR